MIELKPVLSEADIAHVSAMAYRIFPADYNPYVRPDHVQFFLNEFQSVSAIQNQIENGYFYFFIYHNHQIAGYLAIYPQKTTVELSKLYLEFDKRNQGIGHWVMNWLDTYATTQHIKTVDLFVLEKNTEAIRFYTAHGYRQIDTYKREFLTSYSEVNAVMQKRF